MDPLKKAARIAGAVYLSMVVTGPFSLIYVPSKLIVRGDAAATAGNILAHETMFRLAILADLVGQVIFIVCTLKGSSSMKCFGVYGFFPLGSSSFAPASCRASSVSG